LLLLAILFFIYFLFNKTIDVGASSNGQTICQKNYKECIKQVNGGMMDLFCDECDVNGNYKSNMWSHPLSNNHCCKNIKTGKLYNCIDRSKTLVCS
jgi:hypothetical protein